MALDCRALARNEATTLNLSSSLLIECLHAPPLLLNCVMNWNMCKKNRVRRRFFLSMCRHSNACHLGEGTRVTIKLVLLFAKAAAVKK